VPVARLAPRRRLLGVLGLLALALVCGCQLDVAVDVRVNEDGSGSVTVGVGLDDAAVARVGNLDRQLRVDDLAAAGWAVTAPIREGDLTWVRATKGFSTPDEASVVLSELTGSAGPFRDFEVRVDEGMFGTDYEVSGTVDLRDGPSAFGDEELSVALGGDPFGGTLEVIEREEGRPIAEMVRFGVAIDVPGQAEPAVFTPGFADAEPTQIDVSSSSGNPLSTVAIWSVIGIVVVVGVVVLRQGFRRVNR